MKNLLFIILILVCLSVCGIPLVSAQEVSGTVDITYVLNYTPTSEKNQVAVWIEDNERNYVKSLYATLHAANGKWKVRPDMLGEWARKADWVNATQVDVDAITSVIQAAGSQKVVWNLTDQSGEPVSAGTYIYKVEGFKSGTNCVLWRGRIHVGGKGNTSVAEAIYTHSDAAEKGLLLEDVRAAYFNSYVNQGSSQEKWPDAVSAATTPVTDLQKITLNGVEFLVNNNYQFFTWKELPPDLIIERMPVKQFTSPDGVTHYYEVVHYPEKGSINWHQAAYLAQDAGGYLACPTSEEENSFIFSLVNDRKFFWFFPAYREGGRGGNHYEISMGPWLGGYQPKGSPEPGGGWTWLSGEEMIYKNWAKDLDDGVIDRDPRDNSQPNNSSGRDQRTMGYGEMNIPVPTWGDYSDGSRNGGFIIEYDRKPKR